MRIFKVNGLFAIDQIGAVHFSTSFVVMLIVGFAVIGTFKSVSSHASGQISDIKSISGGFCLNDPSSKPGSQVDVYKCNDTTAQAWSVTISSLKHGSSSCLAVLNNAQSATAKVVLNPCDNSAGQIWFRDAIGFYNPNAQLCLSATNLESGAPLETKNCAVSSDISEQWSTTSTLPSCSATTKGDKVACQAEKEWINWQSGSANHEALLNTYTDGAPYEEWCADFVSYVYKQAGYPFTGGEASGWDESNANNIQNMGFTTHDPSNYTPKPGDIGYFNYEGGHVEIVVSGGKTPTFIYGNSATIDPTTGNGQMESNTITKDGSFGSLVYYLSPN